jgi:hypothetical protein
VAALAPSGVAAAAGRSIVLPGQTPEGEHVLSVLVKRTYRIRHGYPVTRSPADAALVPGDVHFGDPMNSTVRHESDFVPWKCETDVVLDGTAQSPDGTPVQALTARLAIGNASKSLLVLGDRIAHHRDRQPALFSDPRPFTTMPLRYELAYGGVDVRSDPTIACVYGRNHLGRGFVIRDAAETVDGLALPNIEDPEDRLTPQRLCCGHFMEMDRQPVPQCFGWIMKYWRPRMLLAGVMPADAALARELRTAYRRVVPPAQWPLYDQTELPPMDFRFFNGASPGLVMPYLVGDEGVQLDNLSPGGVLAFQLPGERPAITLDIGFGPARGETVLQTVMIRVDAGEVDLVWRAATPFPGPDWLPEMRRFDLDIAG